MDDFPHSKFPSFLLPAGWVTAEHPVDCKKPTPIIPKGTLDKSECVCTHSSYRVHNAHTSFNHHYKLINGADWQNHLNYIMK